MGTTVLIVHDKAPFRELAPGKFGSDVFRLQVSLGTLGFFGGPADGRYGEGTKKAVVSFQKSLGVEATGIADRHTSIPRWLWNRLKWIMVRFRVKGDAALPRASGRFRYRARPRPRRLIISPGESCLSGLSTCAQLT